jgi:hypothetical protein
MNNKITALNCNGNASSDSEIATGITPPVADGVTPIEPILIELSPVRAAIIGDDTCTADGITARAHAPALALCRKLIEAGCDPDRPLHAYRGDTLSLRVRSIGEGARWTVKESRFGTPVLHRWREPSLGAATAPPMRPSVGATPVQPATWEAAP